MYPAILTEINNNNHIKCESPTCMNKELEFLVDTGSDVNIIKDNVLTENVLIDRTQTVNLRGINDKVIQTLGKLTIPLIFQGHQINTEFNLVDKHFPIRKNGILGNR